MEPKSNIPPENIPHTFTPLSWEVSSPFAFNLFPFPLFQGHRLFASSYSWHLFLFSAFSFMFCLGCLLPCCGESKLAFLLLLFSQVLFPPSLLTFISLTPSLHSFLAFLLFPFHHSQQNKGLSGTKSLVLSFQLNQIISVSIPVEHLPPPCVSSYSCFLSSSSCDSVIF